MFILRLDEKFIVCREVIIFKRCGTPGHAPYRELGGHKVNFNPRKGISKSKNLTLDTQHDLTVRSFDF